MALYKVPYFFAKTIVIDVGIGKSKVMLLQQAHIVIKQQGSWAADRKLA